MYWRPDWQGRTLSYTVDLSQVGCGCNVALYVQIMIVIYPSLRGSLFDEHLMHPDGLVDNMLFG